MKNEFDEYRITLFKKKIRETLPEMKRLRFERSIGRCHLIINLSWRYQRKHVEEIGQFVMGRLKERQIDFKEVRDKYGIWAGDADPLPLDCISIPIDQAALPERKRASS